MSATYETSKEFYAQALAPLGYAVAFEVEGDGLRVRGRRRDWTSASARTRSAGGAHVAFTRADRATVDAFYEAALAAGGTDNGPPGIRDHYHDTTTAPSSSTPTATTSRRCATMS